MTKSVKKFEEATFNEKKWVIEHRMITKNAEQYICQLNSSNLHSSVDLQKLEFQDSWLDRVG